MTAVDFDHLAELSIAATPAAAPTAYRSPLECRNFREGRTTLPLRAIPQTLLTMPKYRPPQCPARQLRPGSISARRADRPAGAEAAAAECSVSRPYERAQTSVDSELCSATAQWCQPTSSGPYAYQFGHEFVAKQHSCKNSATSSPTEQE